MFESAQPERLPNARLAPPPGLDALPPYDNGWVGADGSRASHISYTNLGQAVNWSAELEALHEEPSRTHFLDRWTRSTILAGIGRLPPRATIADLGCSTGHLLADLRTAHPDATLIGVDLVATGLTKAHATVPSARVLQGDVCALPLADASLDAIVSADLLEHVPDNERARREAARVLRPGAPIAVVMPAGASTYDYYDRCLGHERRHGLRELARKCRAAGLMPVADCYIASLLYPPFWLVKQLNRLLHDGLRGDQLRARGAADIANAQDSRVGHILWRREDRLARARVTLPFGVRSLVVARRKAEES
jgi:ubiquinone/menaquinone biosynthesis C-methylase UbiE